MFQKGNVPLAPLLQSSNSSKFSEMGGGEGINFCGPIVIKTPQIPALAFALSPTEKPQIKKKTVVKAVFCFNFVDLFAEELATFLSVLDRPRWLQCPLDVLASCGFRQKFITVAAPTLLFC